MSENPTIEDIGFGHIPESVKKKGSSLHAEHTDNPTDIKLTQEQADIVDEGGVLLLNHALCDGAIRLWKEPQDGEEPL